MKLINKIREEILRMYSDASWKADKEKEWLRKNGILSLPEALRLLEEEKQ